MVSGSWVMDTSKRDCAKQTDRQTKSTHRDRSTTWTSGTSSLPTYSWQDFHANHTRWQNQTQQGYPIGFGPRFDRVPQRPLVALSITIYVYTDLVKIAYEIIII